MHRRERYVQSIILTGVTALCLVIDAGSEGQSTPVDTDAPAKPALLEDHRGRRYRQLVA